MKGLGDDLDVPTALPVADDPGSVNLAGARFSTPNISEAWQLMDTWIPAGNRWEGLMHRTCALHLFDKTQPKPAPLFTEGMQRAYERGVAVRKELSEGEGGGRDTLVWIDLPGEEAIACAMGLASLYIRSFASAVCHRSAPYAWTIRSAPCSTITTSAAP